MNLKYIKLSVYIMSALLVIGIPVLIIGMIKTSHNSDTTVDTSQVQPQMQMVSSNIVNLEKFGNINIVKGQGFKCDKPQFKSRLILIYCTNHTNNKKKIISIDLYNGSILGTINY